MTSLRAKKTEVLLVKGKKWPEGHNENGKMDWKSSDTKELKRP